MSHDRSWTVPCRLGPFSSAERAAELGISLAPTVVIGHHLVAPIDGRGWCDRLMVVGESITASCVGAPPLHEILRALGRHIVVVYSRRYLDLIDERDAEEAVLTGSWLATAGIELRDWFVLTRHTARSIPTDFDLPRPW